VIDISQPYFPSAACAAQETQSTMETLRGYLQQSRKQLKTRIAEQAGRGFWETSISLTCLGTAGILKGELTEGGYLATISRTRPSLYVLTVFWFPSDRILELLEQSDEVSENESSSHPQTDRSA